MPPTFQLQVATQQGLVLSDEVAAVVAPGAEGYLGILAHHAPLVTEIGVGELKVTHPDDSVSYYAVAGGILEVLDNRVLFLADTAEESEQIDIERAREAQQRAARRLEGAAAEDVSQLDLERARVALMRALNRLHVASRGRR
jgi:F-type H+-transporting ATPase subunit epsilon